MTNEREAKHIPPYTALAVGYDVVMRHVPYDMWAEYAHGLLLHHHEAPEAVLELGCGTGSLALEMQPLGPYDYLATDGSTQMIEVARRKAALRDVDVRFEVLDFSGFAVEEPVDAVILLYDGLNYLLQEEEVRGLLVSAFDALKPGGVFLFDQSTPANSLHNAEFFEDEGSQDGFTFVRHSSYDAETRLHTTVFDISIGEVAFRERHVQRAYHMDEVLALIRATPFEREGAYDDFSTEPATEASDRIHWVLKKPAS